MANAQKYNRAAVGHLGKHYERGRNENGELVNFGNQDIKPELSYLNYNLAPDRNMNHSEFINKRTGEVQCLNRKDINVMCSWVVTLPKDFPKEDEREFFHQTYDFLKNRYGGEKNVVSAYVHKDENQPHIHFAFVPVTYDKKKNIEKVSAKEVIDRKDLQTFHKDLSNHLELYFERKINILNESTKEGNKSIEDLKRGTAIKKMSEIESRLYNLKSQLDEAEKIYFSFSKKIELIEIELNILNTQKNALKKELSQMRDILDTHKELSSEIAKLNANKNKIRLDKDIVYDMTEDYIKYKPAYRKYKKETGIKTSDSEKFVSVYHKLKSLDIDNETKILEFRVKYEEELLLSKKSEDTKKQIVEIEKEEKGIRATLEKLKKEKEISPVVPGKNKFYYEFDR